MHADPSTSRLPLYSYLLGLFVALACTLGAQEARHTDQQPLNVVAQIGFTAMVHHAEADKRFKACSHRGLDELDDSPWLASDEWAWRLSDHDSGDSLARAHTLTLHSTADYRQPPLRAPPVV